MLQKRCSPNENLNPLLTNRKEMRKRENQDESNTPFRSRNGEYDVTKKLKEQNARDDLAVAGRVSAVHLENFMCHANLEIDFDTSHNNCFYIGGPNGSGKSALFAAINIGLGGRGSDNDRGNTVRGYIKDGTTTAKISVMLTNYGVNSHPDYGEYVIIERTINQSTSSYVLKSVEGFGKQRKETVISKKKSDVDRLINRYNIHLSNPAFWMSQDRSRSFLANLKPANVYKLYIEATNLDSIQRSYEKCANNIGELMTIVKTKNMEIAARTRKLKEMQQVRSMHEKISEDQKDIALFQWNLMFCAIRDGQDNLDILQNSIEENAKLSEKNKQKILKNREKRREYMLEVDSLAEEVEELKKEIDLVKEDHDKLTDEIGVAQNQISKHEDEIRKKDYEIRQNNSKINLAKEKIRAIMEKFGNSNIKNCLEKCGRELEVWKTERISMEQSGKNIELQNQAEHFTRTCNRINEMVLAMEGKVRGEKEKLEILKDKLKRSQASKVNTINRFGSSMSSILSGIDRYKSQFQKLPKGPFECISQVANNFLCHCPADAQLLRKIYASLRLSANDRPNIIVSRFLGRRYKNLMEPDSHFNTVYRMLNISDPDVHNALIDKSSVESILLLEENVDAMKFMDSSNPPVNATKAFTLDGSQAFCGRNNSQYRFYTGRKGAPTGLFEEKGEQIDEKAINVEIERINASVKEMIEEEINPANRELKNAQLQKIKAENELRNFEERLTEVRRKEIDFERKINDMESEMESGSQEEINNMNACIEELQRSILEIEKEKEEFTLKIEKENGSLHQIKDRRNKIKKEKSQLDSVVSEKAEKLSELGKKVTDIDNEYKKYDMMKNSLEASKQRFFQDEVMLKQQLEDVEKLIAEKKKSLKKPENAEDPPDLSNFPSTEDAQKIYKEKIRKIELAKEGIDHSITMEMVQEFKDSLKNDKMMANRIYGFVDRLNQILKQRISMFPMLKKYTEMKVREKFKELLAVRGHEGDLIIDNDKKSLYVDVRSTKINDDMNSNVEAGRSTQGENEEPQYKKLKTKGANREDVRDLKGLSGGERSFVTAALVMSLWEVMEQPFRMMDEFDVFMDMMNRKIVMDLLVELATKKFPHNQFIFFTPQGIKELKRTDGLQIFEMNKVRD